MKTRRKTTKTTKQVINVNHDGKNNGYTGRQKREAWGANMKALRNESPHADTAAFARGVAAVVVLGAKVKVRVTGGATGVGGVGGGS